MVAKVITVPMDDEDEDDDVWYCDWITDGSTVWSGNSTATYMGQPSSSNYCTLLRNMTCSEPGLPAMLIDSSLYLSMVGTNQISAPAPAGPVSGHFAKSGSGKIFGRFLDLVNFQVYLQLREMELILADRC